ncbi:MAG: ABC transporter permease [Chloroflexota bacterium]
MSLNRFGFVILTIAILAGLATALGSEQNTAVVILASFLATTLRVATPLTLGALSGLYCERSGVVNIAIEGMMLGAAFFGWLGAIKAAEVGLPAVPALAVGVVVAMLAGVLFALLHAVLSITFRVDQIISGTVINILAVGLTGFLNRALFFQQAIPHAPGTLPTIHIPLLADIPVAGRIFEQQPVALTAIVLVFFTHWVIFSTRWGLRTRAVGENPLAADTVGINVFRMRYFNVMIGGAVAGLAGAYFTLESVPSFEPGLTAGRGFISLAAMIFGNWTPFGAWAAALLFGASQALQINAQYFGLQVPSQLVGALPYLLTMLVLSGVVGRTVAPAADGKAYEK